MKFAAIGLHIWVTVLVFGTVWRLATYHGLASHNTTVNHIAKAMAIQY